MKMPSKNEIRRMVTILLKINSPIKIRKIIKAEILINDHVSDEYIFITDVRQRMKKGRGSGSMLVTTNWLAIRILKSIFSSLGASTFARSKFKIALL